MLLELSGRYAQAMEAVEFSTEKMWIARSSVRPRHPPDDCLR